MYILSTLATLSLSFHLVLRHYLQILHRPLSLLVLAGGYLFISVSISESVAALEM